MLSPFAPHITEELWQKMGHDKTITFQPWPGYDESKLQKNMVTIVGQVNGKVRSKIEVETGTPDDEIIKLMKENEKMNKFLDGKEIVKEIFIKNKLVNIVVR